MKTSTKALILAAVAAMSIGFSGCGSSQKDAQQASAQEQAQPEQTSVTIFVPKEDGSGLAEQKVTMDKVAAQPIQILLQMVKADGGRTFGPKERIYNVWYKGKTAIVEVSPQFAEGQGNAKEKVDAIVKTLRKCDGIDNVQFAVEGELVNKIGDNDVSKPLN